MPATARERVEGRRYSGQNGSRQYWVDAASDELDARAALLAEAPNLWGVLARRDRDCEVFEIGEQWFGLARYELPGGAPPETGDSVFNFDTSGGTQHITQSLANVSKTAAPGKTAPDFKGGIGVTADNVEGVDITVPVFSFGVTRYMAPGSVSSTYVGNLYKLTGKVNTGGFSVTLASGVTLSFAAGECLFLGASGSQRGEEDWEIGFRFAGSPNRTDLTVGDITVPSKKGWEYLWVRYADEEDGDAKALVKRPVAAYVEKVYEEGDFGQLGLS